MTMYYILIWKYHDTYVRKYDSLKELNEFLNILKVDYGNDSDFSYEVYYGHKISLIGENV